MNKKLAEIKIQELNQKLSEQEAPFRLKISPVLKDRMREGLLLQPIDNNGNSSAPVLYPDTFWWDRDNHMILSEMEEIFRQTPAFDPNFFISRDYILKHVIPHLLPGNTIPEAVQNQALFKKFLDLTVTFHLPLKTTADKDGTYLARICPAMAEQAGITVEEIYSQAVQNQEKGFLIRSMPDMLRELEGLPIEQDDPENPAPADMYVVTTRERCYGAAMILSPKIRDKIFQIVDEDYVILPSSIHECIIIRKDMSLRARELTQMIQEINLVVVDEEDILADHAYLCRKNGDIGIFA